MTHSINAVFESGVFRPLELVELAEGARVVLKAVEATDSVDDEADEQTQIAWGQFLDRMQAMPDDGLSNRDHDQIIYGGSTDYTSREIMNRLGIAKAFAFDVHFRQFGTVKVVP